MYVSPLGFIQLGQSRLESIREVVADDSTISELLRGLKKLYMVSKLGLGRYVTFSLLEDLGPPAMEEREEGDKD
jgi:hypothetical protein